MLIEQESDNDFEYLNKFTRTISGELKKAGLKFEVKKRTKSIFSIRRKMRNQHISFEEVYDKYAIRIILDSKLANEKSDCWKVSFSYSYFFTKSVIWGLNLPKFKIGDGHLKTHFCESAIFLIRFLYKNDDLRFETSNIARIS